VLIDAVGQRDEIPLISGQRHGFGAHAAVAQAARSRGLILLTCGTYGNVIRLLPPVTMPDELFAEGMEILEQALRDQP